MKNFKCPYCSKRYVEKSSLYTHMETTHLDQLNGLSPARDYFNKKYKKTKGQCVVCKRETKFNETTERYERFDRDVCKETYVKEFQARMMNKYGKKNLLNEPDQQKKMLERRKISGTYKWSDGTIFNYVGSYEKDALIYLDKELEIPSKDLLVPAPNVINYKYDGKNRFYIPDFYISSLNLLIEIKGSNNHYQKRDKGIELAKDRAAKKSEYNYVKVLDKKYNELADTIKTLSDGKSD